MNPIDPWRESLDPPAGGLARLVRGVEARHAHPPHVDLRLAFSASAVVLALALGIAHYQQEAQHRAFARQLRSAFEAERREHGIARDLPSARADVRIVVLSAPPAGR